MKKNKTPKKLKNKIIVNINKIRFSWFLVGIYALVYLLIVIAFYPGFMSYDSIHQYSQIQGLIPLSDWHPPAMVLLWEVLINITGLTGSLLMFTVGMFVMSSFLLSLYFYRITKNKIISTLPLAFLLLPNILTFLGVLWKDVLLAAFFMLGSILILLGSSNYKTWRLKKSYSNVLLLSGAFVLIFGSTFRHGVWPAFITILFFAAYQLQLGKKLRLLIAASFILLSVIIPAAIMHIYSVKDGQASIVILVDDIINISTELEIRNSMLSDSSKDYLIDLKRRCEANGVIAYAAFLCDDTHTNFSRTVQKEYSTTQDFWIQSIRQNPIDYINHRTAVYLDFLDPSYILAWQERVEPNQFNIEALNSPVTYLMEDYIKFFIRNWPSLFKPYFWLLVTSGLFIATIIRRKQMQHSTFIIVVSLSSILLLLSFLPAAIVSDYRMTYTFTFASGLVSMLYIVDNFNIKAKQKKNNKKAGTK